jgi:hypothetical protein
MDGFAEPLTERQSSLSLKIDDLDYALLLFLFIMESYLQLLLILLRVMAVDAVNPLKYALLVRVDRFSLYKITCSV